MKAYRSYVQHLERLATVSPEQRGDWRQMATLALDGEPGRKLAEVIDLESRREMGAFFTGVTLAREAIARPKHKPGRTRFFDPTCGAGDLLLAATRYLPICGSLQATLDLWGTRLAGWDIRPEFVRAAKARLALMALHRGAHLSRNERLDLHSVFPLIAVGNGLRAHAGYPEADWVVMNPPFGYMDAPEGCGWTSGKTTAAAIFFEACLEHSANGTRITAILPEVLRSGTRYRGWRQMVAKQALINRIKPYGLFDQSTDIDVFILDVIRRPNGTVSRQKRWTGSDVLGLTKVKGLFAVHVGPVVPHRHRPAGPAVPYIHARAIPPWKRVEVIMEQRRFNGSLFIPPFVAIRRTSRPEDAYRATATLITGHRPVAVENHLIVCCPRDGTITTCQQLLRQLRKDETNNWLNARIRCRHLTVAAIEELPMGKDSPSEANRRL